MISDVVWTNRGRLGRGSINRSQFNYARDGPKRWIDGWTDQPTRQGVESRVQLLFFLSTVDLDKITGITFCLTVYILCGNSPRNKCMTALLLFLSFAYDKAGYTATQVACGWAPGRRIDKKKGHPCIWAGTVTASDSQRSLWSAR